MAVVHEKIQVGRWDKYLRRFFNLKAGTPQILSDVIVGSVELGAQPAFDQRINQGWQSYGSIENSGVAPGVGNVNQYRLLNPADSGVLVYLEGVIYEGVTATDVIFSLAQNLAAGGTMSNNNTSMDTRQAQGSTPSIRESTALFGAVTIIPAFPLPHALREGRAVTFLSFPSFGHVPSGVILSPGYSFLVTPVTTNLIDRLAIYWSERAFEKSEALPSLS